MRTLPTVSSSSFISSADVVGGPGLADSLELLVDLAEVLAELVELLVEFLACVFDLVGHACTVVARQNVRDGKGRHSGDRDVGGGGRGVHRHRVSSRAGEGNYGQVAAEALGIEPERVFKTLVANLTTEAGVEQVVAHRAGERAAVAARTGGCVGRQASRDVPGGSCATADRLRGRRHQPVRPEEAAAHGHRRDVRAVRHHLRQRWQTRPRHRDRPRRPGQPCSTQLVAPIGTDR